MKSRGELGSRESWCSRTLRAMRSFMPPKFRNTRRCGPGTQSRRLGKMLYIWGPELKGLHKASLGVDGLNEANIKLTLTGSWQGEPSFARVEREWEEGSVFLANTNQN